MKISFWGAVGGTTGSRHQLTFNGGSTSVLLDCGMFQGRRKEARERNLNFPFDPTAINALILSHAHIDHSGNIPNLVRQGYKGCVFTTSASMDLCSFMLRDSAYIQEKDVEYLNKKRKRKGEPPVEPLYTIQDAEASLENFHGVGYHRWLNPLPSLNCRLWDAGHILGSSIVDLTIRENGNEKKLIFTGDLGRKNLPILRDPELPPDGADYLIIEATYGNRLHSNIEQVSERICEVLGPVLEKGGKVIIPSFAVERTQEIVYCLNELWNTGCLPKVPVFVDSPLAVNVTEIFRVHPECYDEETRRYIDRADDPFGFDQLTYIRDVEKSKELNHMKGPMIIISASGMCEAGRILHHLKNNIENPNNLVLIVGFQASNTLGRRLIEGHEKVRIFGEKYSLRARVEVMDEFSAHADADELFNFVEEMNKRRPLKKVIIVHGETDQVNIFGQRLRDNLNLDVAVPAYGDEIEL